jgi:hypothetical protein
MTCFIACQILTVQVRPKLEVFDLLIVNTDGMKNAILLWSGPGKNVHYLACKVKFALSCRNQRLRKTKLPFSDFPA